MNWWRRIGRIKNYRFGWGWVFLVLLVGMVGWNLLDGLHTIELTRVNGQHRENLVDVAEELAYASARGPKMGSAGTAGERQHQAGDGADPAAAGTAKGQRPGEGPRNNRRLTDE